jgi:hypothetical protein
MWFRRQFFSPGCILERVRRSGVRPAQSILLNLGYWRTVANRIHGHPIPNAPLPAEAGPGNRVPGAYEALDAPAERIAATGGAGSRGASAS